jgi:hypothetical protein
MMGVQLKKSITPTALEKDVSSSTKFRMADITGRMLHSIGVAEN